LIAGRLARLGATRHFHHGLQGHLARAWERERNDQGAGRAAAGAESRDGGV